MNELEDRFAIPILITPDMGIEEFNIELQKMTLRRDATQAWLQGQLETDDFLATLEDTGVDSFDACKSWAEGMIFI